MVQKIKYIISILAVVLLQFISLRPLIAQEPGFMQYNAAPLTISPALAGSYGTDWRIMTNARSQWLGKSSTYNTQALTVDCKLKVVDDRTYFGLGGMVISDKAMAGLFKSNYFNLNGSYHFALDDNGSGLALGIGLVGNNTRVDFSQLTFDQQITSSGFDRTFPSGELALRNNSSYLSATAGLMYTYANENMYFDAGLSGYRFMKMNRTLLDDPKQFVQPRYTLHSFYSGSINDRCSLMASAMHMLMNKGNITFLGLGMGVLLSGESTENSRVLNLGAYYNTRGVVAPFVGYEFGNYEIGISYDVNVSPLRSGSIANKAIELNISYNIFSSFFRSRIGRFHNPY